MDFITGKLIQFNSKELNLHGFLSYSNNKKIIIHVHGMGGDFFRFPLTWELAKQSKKMGYDLFLINTRGYGLISKIWGKKKKTLGTAHEKFEDCLIDIDSAIKNVLKLGYKEIILSGHSTGCQKITFYQSKKQNKKVKGLILLSPADDFNLEKKRINSKKHLKIAKKMLKNGKGNEIMPKKISNYNAKRFLSFADPKNIEAQLFNYEGKLILFSKIKCPIIAIFGEKDYFAKQKAEECLNILKSKTNSKYFETKIIPKAEHNYKGQEKITVKKIIKFLKNLKK
ncbi:MAG: alpha/beta fold hydrolase [Candidatus ainarchaeum sp.]|nr:alpha/beta fold hydrolase [Candidatus ainarchaeum sp.]